jgi:16S rRNA (uracil1498-N3)-methyltransferase
MGAVGTPNPIIVVEVLLSASRNILKWIQEHQLTQLQRLVISPSQLHGQQIELTPQQQHYLSRVLRLQAGASFIAMNGQGQWWLAILEGAQAQILQPISVQTELPVTVSLMVALPKNGFDEIVRQATELGVTNLIPVVSDRTLLHPSPQKLERWRKIAIEAAEQSERVIVPEILDPIPFSGALSSEKNYRYICEARGDFPHLLTCLQDTVKIANQSPQTTITIATGPEGGWTPAELEQACAAGIQPVSLGKRILRALTAPIVALSLISAAFEQEQVSR